MEILPNNPLHHTRDWGTWVHKGFEDYLTETSGTDPDDWRMNTDDGETGPDAEYLGDENLGFEYAELKAWGKAGEDSFNRQLTQNSWVNDGVTQENTSLFGYNQWGEIRQSFPGNTFTPPEDADPAVVQELEDWLGECLEDLGL